MNLQDLIKEHDLKAGDEVVCVDSSISCYELDKTYKIELNKASEFCINNSYTGLSASFELVKQKPTPHIHCKEIKAWADGAIIQGKHPHGKWYDCDPCWFADWEYRIKPDKPDNTEEIIKIKHQIANLQAKVELLKGNS